MMQDSGRVSQSTYAGGSLSMLRLFAGVSSFGPVGIRHFRNWENLQELVSSVWLATIHQSQMNRAILNT